MEEETKSLAASDDGVPMGASSSIEMRASDSPSASSRATASSSPRAVGYASHRASESGTRAGHAAPRVDEADEDEITALHGPQEPVPRPTKTTKLPGNNVRKMRLERMMSKAELARRANLSVLTIDRVEKGYGCRMDTKRKILEALGLSLADRVRVFGEEE